MEDKPTTKPNKVQKVKDNSINAFIAQAIESNAPVETMERLFSLREKMKQEQAKEEFVKAMADFQVKCPVIEKKKEVKNKDGSLRYKFAPLDAIVEQIKKPLKECELSYTWDTENTEGFLKAICKVTHALGHSEVSEFTIPIDKEGFMTAPQKYASAQTFAKRYALCNALGISTGEEDTDATDVGTEGDAKSDKAKIMFLLRRLDTQAKSKEEIEAEVKKLTKLTLVKKNYSEIVSRLEVLVKEAEEHESSKV